LAATAVVGQQIIPAIVVNHVRGLAVDRNVVGRLAGMQAFPGFRIEFHQTDTTKAGTVGEPQPAIGRIQKSSGVNGMAVLKTVGGSDDAAVFPFVIGRIRIQRLIGQVNLRFGLRRAGGVVKNGALTRLEPFGKRRKKFGETEGRKAERADANESISRIAADPNSKARRAGIL